jgi:hypothetical protein
MDKVNAAIISLYMNNIPKDFITYQSAIMDKFNPYRHYQIKTDLDHASSMDYIMHCLLNDPNDNISLYLGNPDVIMFMDIDCIPLHSGVLDRYIIPASVGSLVGNAQRSNHLENNQHIYCGSPAVAISLDTYKKIGTPSAAPTPCGDVAEQWTYKAEESGVNILIWMPTKYDAPPIRMSWETDTRPYWPLKDGQPVYGIGTQYECGTWHMFQSFHPGQHDRFIKKCEEVLNNG